jgi:hypothetical protein
MYHVFDQASPQAVSSPGRPAVPLDERLDALTIAALTRRQFRTLVALGGTLACGGSKNVASPSPPAGGGRLLCRPGALQTTLAPGGLQTNQALGRDALIYGPRAWPTDAPLARAVLLHGGGATTLDMEFAIPLADEFGVLLLVPDGASRTPSGRTPAFSVHSRMRVSLLSRLHQRQEVLHEPELRLPAL